MLLVGDSMYVMLAIFQRRDPPKKSEVSSQVLKWLDTHLSSWNGRGLHDLWGLFPFVLIQLFIHLGTLATEQEKREQRMAFFLGRGYRWLVLMASGEGRWPKGGMYKTKKGEGVLWGSVNEQGWVHSLLGKFSLGGFTHLDTSFGPQFIGGLHLFVLDRSWLFPNCSRPFWLPDHLSDFEDSQ